MPINTLQYGFSVPTIQSESLNNAKEECEKPCKSSLKKKRIRRGVNKKVKDNITIYSNNVAGIKLKLQSLKSQLRATNAAIFTLQETHTSKEGMFRIEGYEIFESIRKHKKDGGTAVGVHKALDPVLIKKYDDDFEIIVVEVEIQSKKVRIITGYGPQETWPESERLPFFLARQE